MATASRRIFKPEIREAASVEAQTQTLAIGKSESSSASPTLAADDVYRMIEETAYFKAEARGFAPGIELQDWLEAEREVRERLKVS
jgi:hypothetical protein